MLEIIAGVVLGAFVILIPGFILTLVIYPKKNDLDFWERIAVSLGLGCLLLIYLGLVLALPRFKLLQLGPFLALLLIFCVVCGLAAYKRGGSEVVTHYRRITLESVEKLVRKIRYIFKPKSFQEGEEESEKNFQV